jgi:hypothetical protein
MKALFYIPLVGLLILGACDQKSFSDTTFIKAGFGVDSSDTASMINPDIKEGDMLLAQLPEKVIEKIEGDRKLRYLELENVIKYKVLDTMIYDLTFLNIAGRKKTVKFDQNGNIIQH